MLEKAKISKTTYLPVSTLLMLYFASLLAIHRSRCFIKRLQQYMCGIWRFIFCENIDRRLVGTDYNYTGKIDS